MHIAAVLKPQSPALVWKHHCVTIDLAFAEVDSRKQTD